MLLLLLFCDFEKATAIASASFKFPEPQELAISEGARTPALAGQSQSHDDYVAARLELELRTRM